MFQFKLLIISLLFAQMHACEKYLIFSKIDPNIDLVLKHIKSGQVISENTIHGFHHYQTKNITDVQNLKTCKINDNLWVVTKGNPNKFHSGFVLCIDKEVQALSIKNFFPSAWNEHTLSTQISNIISEVKSGNYKKITCKKIKDGYAWMIETNLKNHLIRVIVSYNFHLKKTQYTSIFPHKSKVEDVDIDSSIIFEIMKAQMVNKAKDIPLI
jgi:hypothetical protein